MYNITLKFLLQDSDSSEDDPLSNMNKSRESNGGVFTYKSQEAGVGTVDWIK